MIPLITGRWRLTRGLGIHEISSLQVGWDKGSCGDRPITDLPAWEGEVPNDPDRNPANGQAIGDAGPD
jgi:hypothetical protein